METHFLIRNYLRTFIIILQELKINFKQLICLIAIKKNVIFTNFLLVF